MYRCVYVCMYLHTYVCMYAYVCICLSVCVMYDYINVLLAQWIKSFLASQVWSQAIASHQDVRVRACVHVCVCVHMSICLCVSTVSK